MSLATNFATSSFQTPFSLPSETIQATNLQQPVLPTTVDPFALQQNTTLITTTPLGPQAFNAFGTGVDFNNAPLGFAQPTSFGFGTGGFFSNRAAEIERNLLGNTGLGFGNTLTGGSTNGIFGTTGDQSGLQGLISYLMMLGLNSGMLNLSQLGGGVGTQVLGPGAAATLGNQVIQASPGNNNGGGDGGGGGGDGDC